MKDEEEDEEVKQEKMGLLKNLIEVGDVGVTGPQQLADLAEISKLAGSIWLRFPSTIA